MLPERLRYYVVRLRLLLQLSLRPCYEEYRIRYFGQSLQWAFEI